MNGTHETCGILSTISDVRGTERELTILLDIAQGQGPLWRELRARQALTESDRDAISRLRERLAHLLADAQRRMEEILVQGDAWKAPGAGAPAGTATAAASPSLPEGRGSAAGAYLAMSALRRPEPTAPAGARQAARPEPDRYAAAARVAVDGRQAAIGELTAQIVQIQQGLGAL